MIKGLDKVKITPGDWNGDAKVVIDGKKYTGWSCDEDGHDLYPILQEIREDKPPCIKISETTYKGGESAKEIDDIMKLSEHEGAVYDSGRDEDGDHFWQVVFTISDFAEVEFKKYKGKSAFEGITVVDLNTKKVNK